MPSYPSSTVASICANTPVKRLGSPAQPDPGAGRAHRFPRSSAALRALLHPGHPVDAEVLQDLCVATGGDSLGGRTVGTVPWTCRSRRTTAVCARGTPRRHGHPAPSCPEQGTDDATASRNGWIYRPAARSHRTPTVVPSLRPTLNDFAFALVFADVRASDDELLSRRGFSGGGSLPE